jgi:DNA-binding MarR family transcriptional regulator
LATKRAEGQGKLAGASRRALVDRFVELMNGVSLHIRPNVLQAWSEIELTMHQFRILFLLAARPQRVSDVADHLGVRLSSATNLADRLEAKGLIERVHDAEDRRVVWCRLTPLGQKEAQNLWSINREWIEQVAGLLQDDELNALIRAFEALSSAMDRQVAARAG